MWRNERWARWTAIPTTTRVATARATEITLLTVFHRTSHSNSPVSSSWIRFCSQVNRWGKWRCTRWLPHSSRRSARIVRPSWTCSITTASSTLRRFAIWRVPLGETCFVGRRNSWRRARSSGLNTCRIGPSSQPSESGAVPKQDLNGRRCKSTSRTLWMMLFQIRCTLSTFWTR